MYHVYNPNDSKYTEFFDNKYLSLNIRISDKNELVAGSLLNSFGNRCAILGATHNWHNFSNKLSFEGLYAYVGEFFFDGFDNCGDRGIYKRFEEATNIAFAPYIYIMV